jgi:O-antigen/teichoic acid export membrane protein
VTQSVDLRRLARESGWLLAGQIAVVLVGLLGVRLLVSALPPAVYGDVNLIVGLVSLVGTLGGTIFTLGANRFYYEFQREGRQREFMSVVWTGATLASLIGAAILAVAFTLRGRADPLLVGAMFFFSIAGLGGRIAQTVLNLRRRRRVFAVLSTLNAGLAPLAAAAVAYTLSLELSSVIWAYGAGTAAVSMLMIWALYRSGDFAISALGPRQKALLKKLLWFGAPGLVYAVCAWVLSFGDRYVLRYFADSTQVALYSVAYQAGTYPITFFSALFATLVGPLIMQAFAPEEHRVPNIGLYCGVYIAFSVPIIGATLMFPNLFLRVLTADPTYAEAARVIPFSGVALAFSGFGSVGAYVLHLRQRLALAALFGILGATVNMSLNWLLIPRYGYMGAAIATVVGYLAETVLMITYTRRLFRWRIDWRWPAIGVVSAAVAGIIVQAGRLITSSGSGYLLAWGIAYATVCLAIMAGLVRMGGPRLRPQMSISSAEVGW